MWYREEQWYRKKWSLDRIVSALKVCHMLERMGIGDRNMSWGGWRGTGEWGTGRIGWGADTGEGRVGLGRALERETTPDEKGELTYGI